MLRFWVSLALFYNLLSYMDTLLSPFIPLFRLSLEIALLVLDPQSLTLLHNTVITVANAAIDIAEHRSYYIINTAVSKIASNAKTLFITSMNAFASLFIPFLKDSELEQLGNSLANFSRLIRQQQTARLQGSIDNNAVELFNNSGGEPLRRELNDNVSTFSRDSNPQIESRAGKRRKTVFVLSQPNEEPVENVRVTREDPDIGQNSNNNQERQEVNTKTFEKASEELNARLQVDERSNKSRLSKEREEVRKRRIAKGDAASDVSSTSARVTRISTRSRSRRSADE